MLFSVRKLIEHFLKETSNYARALQWEKIFLVLLSLSYVRLCHHPTAPNSWTLLSSASSKPLTIIYLISPSSVAPSFPSRTHHLDLVSYLLTTTASLSSTLPAPSSLPSRPNYRVHATLSWLAVVHPNCGVIAPP
jgi:hypothetical protein